jgi:16S rRNA processing protein RimM
VLGRPHGVAGEILLRLYDRSGRALAQLTDILVGRDGTWTRRRLLGSRRVNDGYLVRLDGVPDREAAAALTLSEVRAPRAALPPLLPGEFYIEDLTGCTVEDEAGRALGTVQGTFWNGAHDVATVVAADGAERLIPIVAAHVVAVDAAGRKMQIRWDDDDQ